MRALLERLLVSSTPARRVLLAVGASVPFFLLMGVVHRQAAREPFMAAALNVGLVEATQWLLLLACAINVLVGLWLWPHRDAGAPCPGSTLVVCVNVGAAYTLVAVLSGPYTSPPSIVLIGILLVGVLLFEPAPLRVAALLCTLGLVGHDVGVLAGWWPYAPALRAALFDDPVAAAAWQGWRTLVFVVGGAVLMALGGLLFARLESLHRQLDALSHTDPLTGLANRRRLMEALEAEVARRRRTGQAFCLVLMDADHFKRVNDTWGHLQGDAVLCALGQVLMAGVRSPTDLAARIGGEEFALLLPDTGLEEAEAVCARLRATVARQRFGDPLAPFTLTVSMGGAVCEAGDARQALREADQQLYLAKALGRDRVCLRRVQGAV